MHLTLGWIFTDNMVIQQERPLRVWGMAEAGSAVAVSFRGESANAHADQDTGRWKVTLGPFKASSEPAELIVTADSDGSRLVCRNVLTGEVWVGSGQSNMEWPVSLANDGEQEIAAANYPFIRLLSITKRVASEPASESSGAEWLVCSPETIKSSPNPGHPSGFSAVAYYFGRELHRRLGVPVGLIHSSVGGTPAETWTSREGFLAAPAIRDIWESFEAGLPSLPERQAAWKEQMGEFERQTRDNGIADFARGYAAVTDPDGDWKEMSLPAPWKARGLDFSGIVWFRKQVEIPTAWAGGALTLSIGATDKSDITYFNGEKVGSLTMQDRPDAWCVPRIYVVPGALVRAGSNLIAVRVHSDKFDAGMTGPAELMSIACPATPGVPPILLAGDWRYAVEANYGRVVIPPEPQGPENQNAPARLFNGMIAPLTSFPIRGIIWYQGESNADRALQYRDLFPALIRDWRRQWDLEDMPFHFVQLANFGCVPDQPCESRWAELREAQTMTLRLPHTGMAVAIDVGEENDVHPRNKQDVGLRLARSALYETYGRKDVLPCGPLFREARREGRALRLFFDHAGSGLTCRGPKLLGFAVAGEDRLFLWADARIDGDTVVIASEAVPDPRFVRYGWADNPICPLCGASGLPASPFRSDG